MQKKVKSRGYPFYRLKKKKPQVFSFLEKWPSANMGKCNDFHFTDEEIKAQDRKEIEVLHVL